MRMKSVCSLKKEWYVLKKVNVVNGFTINAVSVLIKRGRIGNFVICLTRMTMKKVKIKVVPKRNLAVPGKPLSKEEFKELIEEAENGTFHSVSESKKIFQDWRKKHYKL